MSALLFGDVCFAQTPRTVAAMDNAQPTPAEIGALLALLDGGRALEAERSSRALLGRFPDAGMLWKVFSVSLLRQEKDALEALHKASQLLPEDAEAHANLGAALHDRGRWAEGLESLGRALAIQPHAAQILVDAANCLNALGRAREAVPLYQQALTVYPTLLEAHNNLGNSLLSLGQPNDAATCYRRALQITPSDAQIHCNLGNALRQSGLLDDATVSTKQALALDPRLTIAHNNLGLIYAMQGRREEAAASYQQALRLDPKYVDALNNLGHILRDLGRRGEALSLYAQAVEKDPRRAEGHSNMGNILFELRRSEEAGDAYARSLRLQPSYTPAHLGLANILRLRQRLDEAERSCGAALAIEPNNVEALCLLGELQADRGRFSEAEDLFKRASVLKPDFPAAWCGVAAHRKLTADDRDWQNGVEGLLAKQLPLGHEINLRFALGKYFDDTQQYDRAFGEYARANEMSKRYGGIYDAAGLTGRIDEVMATFDASFLRQWSPHGSASERPVFIIGMPRSGTSLCEQILASHPAVFGAGEVTFWEGAFGAYQKAAAAGENPANLLATIAASYLDRFSPAAGASRVTDKMPANFMYAALIHAAFPNARIIHLKRNPIDTCLSIYFQNFFSVGPYSNDLGSLAHYYGEYVRVTDRWRAILPSSSLLEVPYEALVGDQEEWTRRMLDFVGLPWDPATLEFHQAERAVVTASRWQVRQKIHSSSIGRWRHYVKYVGPLMHLVPADNRREH
jgi:tetratricopeptide (TPR) repeat protein